MSLSLSRKTKVITKWEDVSVTGINDASTFVTGGSLTEVFIPTSGLPNFSPNYTTIDRNVLRDSFYNTPPIRNYAEITASLNFELSGAEGVDTKPIYHPFFYGAFGSIKHASTTVGDLSTNTPTFTLNGNYFTATFVVDSAADFKIGYFIRVYNNTSGTKFIGEITGINGNELTVRIPVTMNSTGTSNPNLETGDNVTTGVIYMPEDTLDLPKLYFDLYRQIAGTGKFVKEIYDEMIVSELSIPVQAAQIVTPTVNLEGSSVRVDDNGGSGYDQPTHPSIDMFPIIGRSNAVWLDISGVIKDSIAEANFTVTNTVYKKMELGYSGPSEVSRTQRECSVTMNLYYEDNSIMEALVNDTRLAVSAVLPTHPVNGGGSSLGDTVAIKIPQARIANSPITDDNGVFKHDLTLAVELPDSTTNALDKEICVQVL